MKRNGLQSCEEGRRLNLQWKRRRGVKGRERNQEGHLHSSFGKLDEWSYCLLRYGAEERAGSVGDGWGQG